MVRATFGAEHASQPGPNGQAMEVVAYGLPPCELLVPCLVFAAPCAQLRADQAVNRDALANFQHKRAVAEARSALPAILWAAKPCRGAS